MADVDHIRRDTLRLVEALVRAKVEARRAELAFANGCEASAARAFEDGRLAVVEADMWQAVGLAKETRPGDLVFGDPCSVCGKDGWPAGSAGNARRIHELDQHEGDPRIEPRWRQAPADEGGLLGGSTQ
jgi:hypothetical protein